jgi:putative acyl-CoA dehydrogenase
MFSSKLVSSKRFVRSCLSQYKSTHKVFNQSSPLENINVFYSDPSLITYLEGNLSQEQMNELSDFGISAGTRELNKVADLAEKNRPVLRQFDQYGNRIDEVEYHSAYHTLMDFALFNGVAAHGFRVNKNKSHLFRSAKGYMENQVEPGHMCPVTMTCAAIPVLQKNPGMEKVVSKIFSQAYDFRNLPMEEKTGVTIGMSMTEKQGGSDVRANTTIASPEIPGRTGQGEAYLLNGHKVSYFFF